MRSMRFFATALLTVSLIAPAFSQAQNKQQDEKIVLGATEVLLDVIVRDKRGRPVNDLTGADFEIYEDGVKQQIESFRLVLREAKNAVEAGRKTEGPAGTTQPAKPRTLSDINVVALVFDRLSQNARGLAREAAASYISERNGVNDFTGVFLIDLSLRTVQPYTDNQQAVSQAIDQAVSTATATYASSTERVRTLAERSEGLARQAASASAGAAQAGAGQDSGAAGAAGAQSGLATVEAALADMELRMRENFEALERDQQGYATTNALLSVVESLKNLPGRKTIIFFSEGLAIPPNVVRFFRSVIAAANRANVAIYAVDSAGLRIESTDAESRREINSLANRRARQSATGRDDVSGPMSRSLERNEDLLRLNPHSGLGDLASETGGLLIANTNNLIAGLRRVDEDMRAHYELTYVPKNTEYDGKFRQISVKVNRANTDVQTRKGYLAVNAAMSAPVLEFEAPALAALTSGRAISAFPLRSLGLSFPESARPGFSPLLVEAPASAFTYFPGEDKKSYNTDFTIVALIRDQSQRVVRKMSQNYKLTGPLDKIDAARRGDVLFYRDTQLPPGKYTIEAVAYDAPSGKASVSTTSVEVPAAQESELRLSSIILIERADRLSAAEQNASNPLNFGEVLLYPNTGDPVSKSAIKQLAFFFTAYTAKGLSDKVVLTIEVMKGGKVIGQISGDLPAPDSSGRIQYASALPLDSFQPGDHELKITVKDSRTSVSRSAKFKVDP